MLTALSPRMTSLLAKCCGNFYNPTQLLSHVKPWNFVAGSRSIGKSTAIAIYFILDYLESGHKFIYCRRTRDEVMLTCHTFFGNAVKIINDKTEYNIKEFKYSKQKYLISMQGDIDENGENIFIECGSIIPLSLEQKYKSANFSEFYNLVYDEFIAKNTSMYLGSSQTPKREYQSVLSLYQTIDRGIDKPYRNETRFFFMGNTATIYNPLYLSIGIAEYVTNNPDAKMISPKNKLWILQQVESVKALKEIENSYAYQLADEEEQNYAYKNKGSETIYTAFIGNPEESTRYDETFTLNGRDYGICHALGNRKYYIGKPRYDVTQKKYSLDVAGHTGIDIKLIHSLLEHPLISWLNDAYKNGNLYFNNAQTKNEWLKYFKYMP